jgi:transcription antitermination protein NusB
MAEERFNPWARRRARRLLLQAIYQWQLGRADAAEIERQFAEESSFRRIDRTFFRAVLRGVITDQERLDALIAPHLDRSVAALDQVERALLRMGAYELSTRIDVPYKVVIDEAVALAREFGAEESHKYINGVLDKIARRERSAEVAANG